MAQLAQVQLQMAAVQKAAKEAAAEAAKAHEAKLLEAQERSDAKFAELVGSMRQQGPVNVQYNPVEPAAAVIRAEKVQKINFNLRKSNRLKPFKVSADTDVKLFLKKFEEELKNMKAMVGMNDDLNQEEYVPIFRSCLDYPIVERVGQVLTSQNKTWATVTIPDLNKLMKDEFGSKQTEVARVLQQFGTQRLVKSPD